MESRDDLLQPSLTEDRIAATAIYSATAGYLSSFFGGPPAAVAFAAVNSRRLGRLRTDAPLLLVGFVLYVGALWWVLTGPYASQIGSTSRSTGKSIAGLLYFALIYLLHRRHYRAMTMMGIEPPRAVVVGGGCFLFGLACTFLVHLASAQ